MDNDAKVNTLKIVLVAPEGHIKPLRIPATRREFLERIEAAAPIRREGQVAHYSFEIDTIKAYQKLSQECLESDVFPEHSHELSMLLLCRELDYVLNLRSVAEQANPKIIPPHRKLPPKSRISRPKQTPTILPTKCAARQPKEAAGAF